jgi:hypothetical protein
VDCFIACAPLHKRFAFVAGNDAVAITAISPNSMTPEVMDSRQPGLEALIYPSARKID